VAGGRAALTRPLSASVTAWAVLIVGGMFVEALPCDGVLAAELAGAAASARAAGLHYVNDDRPGIRRRRCGKGFCFYAADGRKITDEEALRRIRSLAIPPAYTSVWISPDPLGHIQATGRDAKGRKQYRYHPRWRDVRDAVKYERMIAFAETLPRIRERCSHDLRKQGMPRERVLALVVMLLEQTKIRVGNEEYARKNHSFGLTTLLAKHVAVAGTAIKFTFRGKSGKHHAVSLRDRRLAAAVRRCLEIPGQDLFSYIDESGATHAVTSGDVNDYIRGIAGGEFTAKDFRTWLGTVMAADELRRCPTCSSDRQRKREVVRAIESVSQRLGNTPSVCRKSYVHPAVPDAYLRQAIADVYYDDTDDGAFTLRPAERFTLALLRSMAANPPTLEMSLKASLRTAA
jgi:DNA topoisomerase-1